MKDNKHVQSNNAFVRAEQAKLKGKMGNRPGVGPELKKFNANMSNDGAAAEKAGKAVCKGLEDAFPANFNSAVDHVK